MYEVDQYTVSLLHFDDGIRDECGRTWVSNGASVSTDQKVFGNSSLAVDEGKYIYTDDTLAFDFTGEFTIEMWAMFTQYPVEHSGLAEHVLFSQTGDSQNVFSLGVSGMLSYLALEYRNNNPLSTANKGIEYTFMLNKWYHLALVSDGTKYYIFVNGKLFLSYVPIQKIPLLNNKRACIGKSLFPNYQYDCIGYIDEFRISNIARWTKDFEPEMPDSSKALLVITMIDDDQKEYELTKAEIISFIDWFNSKDSGIGSPYYLFYKNFNLGPFQSRKDYIVFDKIRNFEIMEFTK